MYIFWKLDKNYSKFLINSMVDAEYYQYLYKITTNEYNGNLKPSLHHFSDKSHDILDSGITGYQIIVKIVCFLTLNTIFM